MPIYLLIVQTTSLELPIWLPKAEVAWQYYFHCMHVDTFFCDVILANTFFSAHAEKNVLFSSTRFFADVKQYLFIVMDQMHNAG